jgi:hypothetical protein
LFGQRCAPEFSVTIDESPTGETYNADCGPPEAAFESCRRIFSNLGAGQHTLELKIVGVSTRDKKFVLDYLEVHQPATPSTSLEFLAQDYTRTMTTSIGDDATTAAFHIGPVGSRAETILEQPDGAFIRPTDPRYSRTESDELYMIDDPQPGDWKLHITGADIPPEGEHVNVEVNPTFYEDMTPPVTTASLDGPQVPDGSYDGPVTIQLVANDDSSGVAQTEISLDDAHSWGLANGPILLAENGNYTIRARSLDYAGNTEQPLSISFTINIPGQCPPGPDTDGDGYTDCEEDNLGTDPLAECTSSSESPGGPSMQWPADLNTESQYAFNSPGRIDITDLTGFLAPVRRLDKSPGEDGYHKRWDLVPGRGVLSKHVNIQDLLDMIALYPPMLGGARAFGGPHC